MLRRYLNFMRGISVNWYGKLGVILTTSSFVTFLILQFAQFTGLYSNQYIGLITYLLFPALFVIGLILIPIGWLVYKRSRGMSTRDLLNERFAPEDVAGGSSGSRIFLIVLTLSLVNILFLSIASVRMLHFMDGAEFCGKACHDVMHPEWIVYQDSPHARVPCVDCHVGEGIDALIDSKMEGARQMVYATFDLYHKPIPTPVHQLRPARNTCEKCHWPAKFYGSRLQSIVHFDDDEESTPSYTALALRVDSESGHERGGIHWHIAVENEVRYASIDDERQTMIWVDVRQPDGTFKRFHNTTLPDEVEETGNVRVMDCVDCHNRATHVYENPGEAIDQRMRLKMMNRNLPYVKREGLKAITAEYDSEEEALTGIQTHMETFYQAKYPDVFSNQKSTIDSTIAILQDVYARNIHHGMNITWGTYPSFIGHKNDEGGCYRCHISDLEADDGTTISEDCDNCHQILAWDEDEPFLTH